MPITGFERTVISSFWHGVPINGIFNIGVYVFGTNTKRPIVVIIAYTKLY
jgi:hypothetical protein